MLIWINILFKIKFKRNISLKNLYIYAFEEIFKIPNLKLSEIGVKTTKISNKSVKLSTDIDIRKLYCCLCDSKRYSATDRQKWFATNYKNHAIANKFTSISWY